MPGDNYNFEKSISLQKPIIPDSDTLEMFGATVNDILKFDKEVYNTGNFLNRPQF